MTGLAEPLFFCREELLWAGFYAQIFVEKIVFVTQKTAGGITGLTVGLALNTDIFLALVVEIAAGFGAYVSTSDVVGHAIQALGG